MWRQLKYISFTAASLGASSLLLAGGAVVSAQEQAARDYVEDRVPPAYRSARRAEQDDRARVITGLSRARTRGEDVGRYEPPEPVREYAEGVFDSRFYEEPPAPGYYRDSEESPVADDRRPLRAPSSGHYDPSIHGFDDAGPYTRFPIGRSIRGGEDRPDAPGYLTNAGLDSSLANGYRRRGVQEFSDGRGQGVRLDDVYPLDPSVNPRGYRGHYDFRTYHPRSQEDDDRDIETLMRRELLVRPGANLRVSSTGTYTFRNYVDYGKQVRARFRLPVHRRYQYASP